MNIFKLIKTEFNQINLYIKDLLMGKISCVLAKNSVPENKRLIIIDNFKNSLGQYERKDGVSGYMVGSNTFLSSKDDIIESLIEKNPHADLLFLGSDNVFRKVYDQIEMSDLKFRHAYIDGVQSPLYRAVVWTDSKNKSIPLRAHTDWPQVRNANMEYSNVVCPVAVNFYPSHPAKGKSIIRIFNFVPSGEWLSSQGIYNSGYPILEKDLENIDYIDIEPESGDTLFFNSSFVHTVINKNYTNNEKRININGFIGFCPDISRVLAWV